MPLKDLPPDAQPREKLLARGPAALADAELLAIVLRTGIVGKGVLQLAQELLIGLEFSMLDQRKRRIERFQKSFEDLNRVLGTAADRYRHVEKSNAYRLTGDGTDPNRGAAGARGAAVGALGGGGFRTGGNLTAAGIGMAAHGLDTA